MSDEQAATRAFCFTGRWQDYAPIAFTNLLLTVVTLGVYVFWARTRTRRYLWSRTQFIDDRLEWTGTGLELFVGYLLAFVLFVLPLGIINLVLQGVMMRGHQGAAGLMVGLLYLAILSLFGVARFRALRYRLSRTLWHGIRGGSDDQGVAYGWSYFWRTLLSFLTIYLMTPWAMARLWNQRWNAMSFGSLSANAIRALAMDAVEKAKSGHPGMPMGMADVATVLFQRIMKFDAARPDWPDRDRFVLSAGHGSMLIYSLLYLTGYDVSLGDLKNFRQLHSKTAGHPEVGITPGVETTTGPLGQGITNAVGMALAEKLLAAEFNRPGHEVVNHRTWAICSDGDLMEGVSMESASLAGQLRLGRLIAFYDDNRITIDGSTAISFDAEDKGARYEAHGWHVQHGRMVP